MIRASIATPETERERAHSQGLGIARAAIATPQTDHALAVREYQKGAAARAAGRPREFCPWQGGLTGHWWYAGWDGKPMPAGLAGASAQAECALRPPALVLARQDKVLAAKVLSREGEKPLAVEVDIDKV